MTRKPAEAIDAMMDAAFVGEPQKPSRAHESWAESKGFLPVFSGVSRARMNGVENPKHWKYAAAKAMRGWVIGFEVTEEDFDAAVNEAVGVAIG